MDFELKPDDTKINDLKLYAFFCFFSFFSCSVVVFSLHSERKFIRFNICFVYRNGKSICIHFVCTTNMFSKTSYSDCCEPPSMRTQLFLYNISKAKTTCKNKLMPFLFCARIYTLLLGECCRKCLAYSFHASSLLIYHRNCDGI